MVMTRFVRMAMTRFVRMVMIRFVRCNPYTRFDRSIRLDGFSFIGVIRNDWFRVRIDGFRIGFIRFISGIDGINRFNRLDRLDRLDRCNSVFFVARSVDGIEVLRHMRLALDRSRLAACSKVLVQSIACTILNLAMATGPRSRFVAA